MKTKYLTSPRFSVLLVTGVLSMGLLLGGCSDTDAGDDDAGDTSEVATDVENSSDDTASADTQEAKADEPLTAAEAEDVLENKGVQITDSAEDKDKTVIANDDINPMTVDDEQPSLVTNPTEPGTPEDTVKQALNTLYYGDVEDAVGYYRVDMDNFETELANTQSAFRQTVESVTITNTQYSVDRIRATITGELKLKGQSEPTPLTYQLRKVGSEWKILG